MKALWVFGTWLRAAALAVPAPPLDVSFHHIHVNDNAPDHLVGYYAKLFDRSTTKPTTLGPFRGIESAGIYLLITPVPRAPSEEGSAGWHFGWGSLSLDEAYDRHRMQEIEWKLPLESFAKDLHVHIESENPVAAGEWYRDTFGASLQTAPAHAVVEPIKPVYRRPVVIARLDGIALAIYKAAGPLDASRGHRIDHLAFKADLNAARAAGLKVIDPSGRLGPFETMTIEGPDQLAIELVGGPRP